MSGNTWATASSKAKSTSCLGSSNSRSRGDDGDTVVGFSR